ncbi:hypothetical protein COBT_000469 [Conglomerata obtusa]
MKNDIKKHLAAFYQLVKLKDYRRISHILKKLNAYLNTEREKNGYDIELRLQEFEKHKEVLKILMRNEIKFHLVNNNHIKIECIDVICDLDNDFKDEMQFVIVNDIVKKSITELQTVVEEEFYSLGKIGKCFEWFTNKLEAIRLEFSHMPRRWNIEGEFTYNFCVAIRKSLCYFLFNQEIKNDDIVVCFNKILDFETKYTKHIFIKECCTRNPIARTIEFNKNLILINDSERILDNLKNPANERSTVEKQVVRKECKGFFCDHKKMLSQVLVPFLKIYVDNLFNSYKEDKNFSEEEDMKIFVSYINFFNFIGEAYLKLQYFDDDPIYDHLIALSDNSIKDLIKKMGKGKSMHRSCLIINSLYYVRSTFDSLLDKISKKNGRQYRNISFYADLKASEAYEYNFIDSLFKSYTNKLILNKPNCRFTINAIYFLDKNIFEKNLMDMHEDVITCIFEIFLSALFIGILNTKMNINVAEHILQEIIELKKILHERLSFVPFINVIERYLKIFLVDPNESKDFITNFIIFAKDTFQFSQILKMLIDDRNNVNLFIDFKKYSKKSQT